MTKVYINNTFIGTQIRWVEDGMTGFAHIKLKFENDVAREVVRKANQLPDRVNIKFEYPDATTQSFDAIICTFNLVNKKGVYKISFAATGNFKEVI